MSVQSCKRCNILFRYSDVGPQLCPVCMKKDEADFEIVRQFLTEHPLSSGQEVHKATGIPIETIIRWLKDERLVSIAVTGILKCENCGAPILSGKLCTECRYMLAKDFKGVAHKTDNPVHMKTKHELQGMQFLNKHHQS